MNKNTFFVLWCISLMVWFIGFLLLNTKLIYFGLLFMWIFIITSWFLPKKNKKE